MYTEVAVDRIPQSGARARIGAVRRWLAVILLAACMLPTQGLLAQTFPGANTGAIPDGGGGTPPNYGGNRDVTFSVAGVASSLSNVSLSMTLTHTWVGDLDVVLAPPGVTPGSPGSFVIYSRVGALTAPEFGDNSNLGGTYVFNNAATANIWTVATTGCDSACTITPQAYRTVAPGPTTSPAAPTDFTAAFSGLTPAQINGTWTLRFRDGAATDTGNVSAAALTLTQTLPVAPTITSANNTTFTVAVPGNFNVTATGSPAPTFSLTGALPTGVSFTPAGVLSGTPAIGTQGVYPLTITATNGVAPDAAQNFTLTVNAIPPTITSANTVTFTELVPDNFTVTATGTAPIAFSVSGVLPAGISFNGTTGLLSGTPGIATSGVYPLTFTASNGAAPNASQSFTLTIEAAPGGAVATQGVVYSYDNASSLAIPDAGCPTLETRTFNVSETFTVGGFGTIGLGVEIAHANRGQLNISLQAPNGAIQTLQAAYADTSDNINVMYSSNADSGNVLDDGDADPLGVAGNTTHYRRLVAIPGLDTFFSGPANGTWTLRVCDSAGGDSGTLNRARLVLIDAAAAVPQICASRSTFDWGANGDNAAFVSANFPPDNITISQLGASGEPPTDVQPSYFTTTGTTGAHAGHYRFQMDVSNDTELAVESALFGFSTPVAGLAFELLDVDRSAPPGTGWEDYVKVEATGPSGRVAYHMSFVNPNNVSFAGDWGETDLTFPSTENGGNVRFQFLDAVSEVRVVYAQGNEPELDSVSQFIGISDFGFCTYDYADGPASYGTTLAGNGPRHGLVERTRLFIGTNPPDGETDALVTADASGDDTSLINDAAGSISFPPPRLPNQGWVCGSYTTNPATNEYCVVANVTNTTGSAAQLVGWIDFNTDGDFTDAGERSLPELASTATTGFSTGNIAAGSVGSSVVLVFTPPNPIANNAVPGMVRLRMTTDPLFFSDATPPSHLGLVGNGEAQDHAIPINTLPVTLASFNAARLDANRLSVRWTVATEAGTLGYRVLQGDSAERATQVSGEMVPATGVDSLLPQFYEATVASSSSAPLFLEEISAFGRTERFGPFQIGAVSGEELVFSRAHWQQARTELQTARSRENAQRLSAQPSGPAAELLVSADGLQRVSVADLQAIGVSFVGADPASLRLTRGGLAVPFRVSGRGNLSAESVIEFYGSAVDGSLYTRTQPYRLTLGSGLGSSWRSVSAAPVSALASDRLRKRFVLDQDRYYGFSAPGADPWYFDTVQRNGASGGKTWTLATPGVLRAPSVLRVELWGGLDYPGDADDHRYRVLVNGHALSERSFNGVKLDQGTWLLPDGILSRVGNEVRIELLSTAFPRDILRVESITIEALAELRAEDTALGLTATALLPVSDGISRASFEAIEPQSGCGDACAQMLVRGLPDADVLALRLGPQGVTELSDVLVMAEADGWTALLRPPAMLPGSDAESDSGERLVVLSRSQAHTPGLRPAPTAAHPRAAGPAQLLLIAPYRFLADVEPLLQARRAEGLSARVVDVAQIYQHYSDGVVDPAAIKAFIAEAYGTLGTRYVLLVGGDTYDYFDRLGLASISDVPTFYGRTHPLVNHAPLDSLYADIDDDGSPELALGRLPARTSDELSAMIAKILTPTTPGLAAVFAAERSNPAEAANYAAELDGVIAGLPAAMQAGAQRIYLDDYAAGGVGVGAARADLVAAVNAGRSLVSYFGHGSPTVWSREQLLQSAQIAPLLSNGQSPVVSEFGCWGGYFVAPEYNSMAHGWLAQSAGASAYLGSTGLTVHDSDRRMAEVLLPALAEPGVRLGDALRSAKQSLHALEPERSDILRGMSLFGDPSMRLPQQP